MAGHTINGRRVLSLGTWEIWMRGGLLLGRVNALDAKQAIKRARRKFKTGGAAKLFAEAMLPTVYLRQAK